MEIKSDKKMRKYSQWQPIICSEGSSIPQPTIRLPPHHPCHGCVWYDRNNDVLFCPSGVVSDTKRASLCGKLTVKRGDIFYADLSGTIGSEQGGTRPVLVVQNDVGNFYSPTIIIAPISTVGKHYLPVHIRIDRNGRLSKDSTVFLEQIRTIDRQRIRHYVGTLDGEIMRKIDNAIKISLGVSL